MRLLLLDQSAPRGLKSFLTGYYIHTANEMGWAAISNGELLAVAEAAGFAILLTSDQNIRFQQNLTGRRISVVSLSTNQWDTIRTAYARVQAACDRVGEGAYATVQFPRPALRRRRYPKPGF